MTTSTHINEYKQVCGDKIVHKFNIIGTDHLQYSVWERTDDILTHSSITWINDLMHGELHSRRLPADLDQLPAWTEERVQAVQAYHNALEVWELSLIKIAYPESIS